ncbi:endonuclease G, mitochondrial-like [Pimephales promelas]|nr:endonuclease G, mitochondrial-like [Pimephales promelas]
MLQVLKRCLYNGGFNRLEEQSDLKEVETSPKLSEEAEITPSETEQGPSEITSEIPSSSETEQEPSEITSEKPPGGEKKVMVQPHSEPSVQLPNRKRSQDCHTSERNNEENFPSKQTFVKTDGFQRLEKMNDGTWTRGLNESSGTVYIRIPLSVMSGDESSCKPEKVKNDNPTYKLIDSVPYFTEIRKKKSYAMLYDNRTRNAAWVYEILNKSTLKKEKDFDRVPFEVDNSIHPFFQTPDVSKLHSNTHHKGHLAAAANHRWCKKAFDDTNVFSNITIQDSNLNTSEWKDFENHLRHKIENNENIRNLHVYTGPLYEPNGTKVSYLMKYDKAVPTHYFKVVIEENMDDTVKLESYVVPNQGITVDLQKWKRPINYIEQVSGLIFTESLSNQGRRDIERTVTWHGKNQDGEEYISSLRESCESFYSPAIRTHRVNASDLVPRRALVRWECTSLDQRI